MHTQSKPRKGRAQQARRQQQTSKPQGQPQIASEFSSEAEYDKYLEWMLSQLPMPSPTLIAQAFAVVFEQFEKLAARPLPKKPVALLSLRQIALIYVYKEDSVPRGKARAIAQQYGHSSGAKLYDHYRVMVQKTNRTGVTGRQVVPMLEDIETIKSHLDEQARQRAECDQREIEAKR